MSTVLTPTAPVRFCIYRLRQSIAETSRFSNDDLVGYINDGYQSACERAAALPAITTLTVPAGLVEANLPTDWARTLRLYQNGAEVNPVAYQDAFTFAAGSYYQYGSVVGVTGAASVSPSTLYMLYARTPAPLGLDDVPEWGGEWNYLLRHYAAYRCMLTASGAESSPLIVQEKSFYDHGVSLLRAATNRSLKAAPSLVRTVLDAV
jgi:hypothetical protein